MRNLFVLLSIISGLCILGCKKTGVPEVLPPDTLLEVAMPTLSGDYFIQDDPSSVYYVKIGFTTIADAPRTVNISYSSSTGAVQGVQYVAPTTITIPAGKAFDTLRIKGLFSGYPVGRKDVLKIKVSGSPNIYPGKDSFLLTLQPYCEVETASLVGNYDNTFEDGSYGPYTSSVENLSLLPGTETKATATITNIYDSNISAVATFDWTNPAGFTVTIAPQQTQYEDNGLPIYVRTDSDAISTFSSCENTITLYLILYTSDGVIASWTTEMAK
jgi:hypothetical protein